MECTPGSVAVAVHNDMLSLPGTKLQRGNLLH